LRVALVCTEKLPVPPVRGGAIQAYIDGVAPLLAREHQVTVISCQDPLLPPEEVRGGVHHLRIPGANRREAYYGAAFAALARLRPEVAVVYNRPRMLPYLARASPGTATVLSLHNEMFEPDKISPVEARQCLETAAATVTVSRYLAEGIARVFPEYRDRLVPIHAGVDLRRFLPRWDPVAREERKRLRRELRLTGRKVILYVGRLTDKKGAHVLLEALGRLSLQEPDAVLLVVGSKWFGADDPRDDYVRRLRRYAQKHLPGRVRFTGWVPFDRVHQYYWAADVFCCSSQWQEPLARVHYEAMATGLPIVTTRRGGNPEVVDGLGNGLVVDRYRDPVALAAALGEILADKEKARAMGRQGRRVAEERFSWDRVARDLGEVLARAAAGAPGALPGSAPPEAP